MNGMATVCELWLEKLNLASKRKWDEFGKFAKDAMRFYVGPYDFMYDTSYGAGSLDFVVEGVRAPSFRMSVNKVAEMVDLFLPMLYERNPNYMVTPKYMQIDPQTIIEMFPPQLLQQMAMMAQQQGVPFDPTSTFNKSPQEQSTLKIGASMMSFVLNQMANESDLKSQARNALVEALIKGMGLLWTEIDRTNSGLQIVQNYDSVDYLLVDPDCEILRHGQWIARQRTHPLSVTEARFRLPRGSLRGHRESLAKVSERSVIERDPRQKKSHDGSTYDTITYWEIYSRIGMGGELSGADRELRETLQSFGQHVYLAIAPGIPYPLNMSPDRITDGSTEELARAVMWPTPFFEDQQNPWPFTTFSFHEVPRSPWPRSHVRSAMGELKALQWISSFMVGKIKNISRDFVVVDKSVEDTIKDAIINGPDLTMLEIMARGNKSVGDFVSFIKHPELNRSLWEVASALEQSFEKRTGVTELAMGMPSGRQIRSATEATMRSQGLSIRPEDMANRVEDAMSLAGAHQAIAVRVHSDDAMIAPIFGESIDLQQPAQVGGEMVPRGGPMTQMFMQLLCSQPISKIVAEYNYQVEAGSVRKPNRQSLLEDANEAMQVLMPLYSQYYAQSGDSRPLNFVLRQYFKAKGWPDVDEGLLPNRQQEMMAMMQGQQQGGQAPVQQGPPQ